MQREKCDGTPLSTNDFNLKQNNAIGDKNNNKEQKKTKDKDSDDSNERKKIKRNKSDEQFGVSGFTNNSQLRRKDSFQSTSISFNNMNLGKYNASSKSNSNTTFNTTMGNSTINSLS